MTVVAERRRVRPRAALGEKALPRPGAADWRVCKASRKRALRTRQRALGVPGSGSMGMQRMSWRAGRSVRRVVRAVRSDRLSPVLPNSVASMAGVSR